MNKVKMRDRDEELKEFMESGKEVPAGKLKTIPYREFVLKECERQWNECQEEKYGSWSKQSGEVQKEYFCGMYHILWDDRFELDCVDLPNKPEEYAWEKLRGVTNEQ